MQGSKEHEVDVKKNKHILVNKYLFFHFHHIKHAFTTEVTLILYILTLKVPKKQTTKLTSANFQRIFVLQLFPTENLKTREQTV